MFYFNQIYLVACFILFPLCFYFNNILHCFSVHFFPGLWLRFCSFMIYSNKFSVISLKCINGCLRCFSSNSLLKKQISYISNTDKTDDLLDLAKIHWEMFELILRPFWNSGVFCSGRGKNIKCLHLILQLSRSYLISIVEILKRVCVFILPLNATACWMKVCVCVLLSDSDC